MSSQSSANKNSLKKNVLYNLIGIMLPLVAAVVATPFLIAGLGVTTFGLLTILWLVLGYFGFLDFGISRALTNTIAKRRGENLVDQAWDACWTAILALLLVFVPISLIAFLARLPLSQLFLNAPTELQYEVEVCVALIAMSLPMVVLTGVLKGALEGFERFDVTNLIRLPMAIWSYAGPVLLLPFTHSIVSIVQFLLVGRLITLLLFAAALFRLKGKIGAQFSRNALRELATTGGWIAASTFMSPLMIFLDRFIVAARIALSQVAYYTTPMDALTKLLQPVDAVASVFFPALSRTASSNPEEYKRLYALAAELIGVMMFMVCSIIAIFSPEILQLWISSEFAHRSSLIMSILSVGIFANALARAPYIALQATGRAKLTAQLQALELAPYLLLLVLATASYGLIGASIAWVIRVSVDATLLFIAVNDHAVSLSLLILWLALLINLAIALCFPQIFVRASLSIGCLGYALHRTGRLLGVNSIREALAAIQQLGKKLKG